MDLATFEKLLRGCEAFVREGEPWSLARSPGRLDVMGGISDYSGSRVLEMPIAESTWAAARGSTAPRVRVASHGQSPAWVDFEIEQVQPDRVKALGERCRAVGAWTAYAAGALPLLLSHAGRRLESDGPRGLDLFIAGDVPEGKGVSSSAAVEVAAARALAAALDIEIDPEALARLCQQIEHRLVGAPCGIMDQMTCVCGRAGKLMALRCQPAEIEGFIPIPPSFRVWGVDSTVRHAVSGADYGTVRAAAFMGRRILEKDAGLAPPGGWLANVKPSDWLDRLQRHLPDTITGSDFLDRYGEHGDSATTVSRERRYPVRAATAHPIHEHHRIRVFAALLEAMNRLEDPSASAAGPVSHDAARTSAPGLGRAVGPNPKPNPDCNGEGVVAGDQRGAGREESDDAGRFGPLLGELMRQSHASYSHCGLGSDATDRLFARVDEAARRGLGLFGAKITGGGSGGTVAVLGRADAGPVVRELVERFASELGDQTGEAPYLFEGSSDGAMHTPVERLAL